ncbi:MAG TPA: energy-coupling factor transporter transmembrane component T [Thermoleophilaceae bacterium]
MSLVPVYRRRASALHAARAGASAAFCLALAFAPILFDNPIILGALLCAVVAAAIGAGVARELRRWAAIATGLALLVVIVNPLVTSDGLTVLVRGGSFLGRRWDITLEATIYGAVAALRVLDVMLAFALLSVAVDPDELLRALRRISYRSALTAALTTRLVPVLARDASRKSEAARCRPQPPGHAAVARAAVGGSLERAVELAAALEVRGYSRARRPQVARAPWSRHDVRVLASALAIAALAVAAKLAGAGGFQAYPTTQVSAGPAEAALAVTFVALAAAPFIGTTSRLGVVRA